MHREDNYEPCGEHHAYLVSPLLTYSCRRRLLLLYSLLVFQSHDPAPQSKSLATRKPESIVLDA